MTSSNVNGDKVRQFPGSPAVGPPGGHWTLSPAAVTGPSKKNREKESGKKGGGEEKEKDQALFKLLQVSIDTASADLGMPLGRKRSDLGQSRRAIGGGT